MDVPYFVTDSRRASEAFGWRSQKPLSDIVLDIQAWFQGGGDALRARFV